MFGIQQQKEELAKELKELTVKFNEKIEEKFTLNKNL